MVEITISWGGQLQGPEADVIQSLIVDAEGFIRILNQLMNRQSGIVRLHYSVGNL